MYLPSMLFGGSALLHLMAGHPRVVTFFGLAAAVTMLVYPPFGPQVDPGTVQYIQALERRLVADDAVDAAVITSARSSARALKESRPAELKSIVDETLATCGAACLGLDTSSVLNDGALLDDVLLIHELTRAHVRAAATLGSSQKTSQ